VQILETKFHTKFADEPGSSEEIRLNPIMKDLIINVYEDEYYMQDGKTKRNKWQKKETKVGEVEGIE